MKPTGAKRTERGSSSSGMADLYSASGERWHSPQTWTIPLAGSAAALKRVFCSGAFDVAAATCRDPGPWHRSQVTPGSIEERSGPGLTPLEWQWKQRVMV